MTQTWAWKQSAALMLHMRLGPTWVHGGDVGWGPTAQGRQELPFPVTHHSETGSDLILTTPQCCYNTGWLGLLHAPTRGGQQAPAALRQADTPCICDKATDIIADFAVKFSLPSLYTSASGRMQGMLCIVPVPDLSVRFSCRALHRFYGRYVIPLHTLQN